MPSRVERHQQNQTVKRRVDKNQDLYQDLRNYKNFVEVSDIESVIEKETYDLEDITPKKRRSEKSIRELETDKLATLFDMDSSKEHDINKILTDAKKLRTEPTELELEEKRKLKKDEYNITSSVDFDKLEEMQKKRKQSGVAETDQEELREIIDTIYSKGLKEEIEEKLKEEEDKDLFSELLPTSQYETVIGEELNKERLEQELAKEKETPKEVSKKIENSFFTKSTELSLGDLEEEDDELFIDDKKLPVWAIILIVVATVAVIGVVGYFIYQSML